MIKYALYDEDYNQVQQSRLGPTKSYSPLKTACYGPGQVAQLVRASSQCTKVVGSIPAQGTCKNQPMNA